MGTEEGGVAGRQTGRAPPEAPEGRVRWVAGAGARGRDRGVAKREGGTAGGGGVRRARPRGGSLGAGAALGGSSRWRPQAARR